MGGNKWVLSGAISNGIHGTGTVSGVKTLTEELTTIEFATTGNFDSGSVNVCMGVITIMIFKFVLFTILFALAYAIKGGQGKYIFPNWERENPLSNKLTSTLIVFITVAFVTVFLQVNIGVGQLAWHSVGLFALGWLLSIAPSLGEEYGAIMARPDKYGEWMPQIKSIRIFGRKFQWVEGHMYGFEKSRSTWRMDWCMYDCCDGLCTFYLFLTGIRSIG